MKPFAASIQAGNVSEAYYSIVLASFYNCLEDLRTVNMGKNLADEVPCMLDLCQQANLTQLSRDVLPLVCIRKIHDSDNVLWQVGELACGVSSSPLLMMTDSSCFPVVCIIYTPSIFLKYFLEALKHARVTCCYPLWKLVSITK